MLHQNLWETAEGVVAWGSGNVGDNNALAVRALWVCAFIATTLLCEGYHSVLLWSCCCGMRGGGYRQGTMGNKLYQHLESKMMQ